MIDRIADPALAASAYGNTANMAGKQGLESKEKPSFGDMVQDVVKTSIDTMRRGEQAQVQAVTGQASLVDVVEAVTAAEMTLQTASAVRNRMLSAYQEIMRMPI